MYVIAASVLGCLAMEVHVFFWGPETLFTRVNFRDEAIIVEEVSPGTAAARAGVRAGDRIIDFAGRRTGSLADWDMVRLNVEANHPYVLRIDRGGQHEELALTLGRRSWTLLPLFEQVGTIVRMGCALLCALLAIVLAFSGPRDPVARLGALALALLSLEMVSVNTGYFSECRRLPLPIGLFVWWPFVAGFLLPPVFFSFCAMFPRTLFRARWAWTLLLLPGVFLVGLILTLAGSVFLNAAPLSSSSPILGVDHMPDLVPQIGGSILLLYMVGGLGALVLNYRRSDVNQRRRIRVLVAGTLVAYVGVVPVAGFSLLRSSSPAARFFMSDGYLAFITLLFAALPTSWAYAIRRHQLFDIRVLLRQGLQYALARRVLLAAVPALGLLLLADVLLHGQQPLLDILRGRGWMYLLLGALAALTVVNRQTWLDTLDRRFFRERYDAQRLLRELVEEIREARTFARVAPKVVIRIEAALHPEFVALVSGEPRETTFRTAAIAPPGHVLAPLPVDSKLVAIVRLLGKPLEVTQSSSPWLAEQLPHEDTDFLRRERIHLVVPVTTGADRAEVLLALGLKRSEEPYSRDDLDLLGAIAASLAFLPERPAGPDARARSFEECPVCGACYDSGATACAQEGASLRPVFLPRLLEARYRLERRLGRGGMGSVYQATDLELERPVAVKVVREDLVGSEETAQRFRREARVAASLSHPNVVTIHDFGVTKEARAYLVMELLEGSTIRERLRETRRFTTAQLLPVLRDVCSALDAAHGQQIVHRDLKPENIFLTRSSGRQTCKVLDFGIAKFFDAPSEMPTADTAPGVLLGTPLYMSPEQRQGGLADPTWDLWALSVIAYEMLAGTHPFKESSPSHGLAGRVPGPLSDIALLTPDAAVAWRTFFEKTFAADPQLRPRSAEQFQFELDAVFA